MLCVPIPFSFHPFYFSRGSMWEEVIRKGIDVDKGVKLRWILEDRGDHVRCVCIVRGMP